MNTDVFESAITRVEQSLKLSRQPKAVIFHEKAGEDGITRRHCHVVWSRIDSDKMRAIPMDYSKRKLNELAKELYLEHEWDLPKGFINPRFRDPKNFTLEEWQQAKRQDQDPREMKAVFQACWKQSDSREAFANSLKQHGYRLARGDRRGYVATDMHGEVYAIPKWVGVKTKDVRSKLGERETLPSLQDAQHDLANTLAPSVSRLEKLQQVKLEATKKAQAVTRMAMLAKHTQEREQQRQLQEQLRVQETQARQERFNKGLRGLFDRITGAYSRTKKQNEMEKYEAHRRHQQQRDALIFRQINQKRELTQQHEQARQRRESIRTQLCTDLDRLEALRNRSSRPQTKGHEREP